ncbi:MAG: hypothetical protein IPI67_34130 [Myxococcales bacterium]|nr:hypothetical protein [Myxococcales bacterium]
MSGAPRSLPCSRCGAPATLSLATDGQRCASCQEPLVLSVEVRAHLATTIALIGDKLAAGRRLDEARVKMLGDERFALGFAVWLVLLSCGGLYTFSGVWAVVDKGFDAAFPGRVVPALGGLFTSSGIALVAALVHRSVRGRLQRTFAALPAESGAQHGACHLCGGPLPAREVGGQGSVRCDYCGTDNLLGRGRVSALGADLANRLAAHASDMRSAIRWMRVTTQLVGLSALVVLPLASIAVAIVLSKLIE